MPLSFAGLGSIQIGINRIRQLPAGGIVARNLPSGIVELLPETKHENLPSSLISGGAGPSKREILNVQTTEKVVLLLVRFLQVLRGQLFENCCKLAHGDAEFLRTAFTIELKQGGVRLCSFKMA